MSGKKSFKKSPWSILIALAVVALMLFAGDFKVKISEEAVLIDATFWKDAVIDYREIDSIELRTEKIPGKRVTGFSSIGLLLGRFRNEEFGSYTRYTFTSCESGIVIRSGDDRLVFNAKDAESTKALYESILEKLKN